MTRRPLAGNPFGRYGQWFSRFFSSSPKPTRRPRRVGMRLESLEARRVMYGADLLGPAEGEPGNVVEAFSLTDVNPNSGTVNQTVSPANFPQHATAWYFGHST